MTHIAYQPKGPQLEFDTDYVVVGSGAGGATVAVELARGGADVVVVERLGQRPFSYGVSPADV